jgi:hypothetical protein
MVTTRWVLILSFCSMLLLPGIAQAQTERRCQELGANCGCSSTFNTQTWTNEGSSWWWPNEPNATRCSDVTINGQRVNWLTTAPQAVPQTLMPAGNTVSHVVRFNNPAGAMIVASVPPSGGGRVCLRVYAKVSPDYQSTNDGACENDKWMEIGDYFSAFNTGFSNSANGGGFTPNVVPLDCANRWCRFEFCIDNYSNPRLLEVYYTNLALGLERIMTFPPRLAVGGVAASDFWIINGYRQGVCRGYREFSHAMMARWATNAGQRIGAAVEVEGGGPATRPATPGGFRISSLYEKWYPFDLGPFSTAQGAARDSRLRWAPTSCALKSAQTSVLGAAAR